MNILFVTGIFAHNETDTALSGMPYAVYKSALGMKKIGHEAAILTVSEEDRKWYYQGLKVISIRAEHGLNGEAGFRDFGKSLYCILKRECRLRKQIRRLHQEKPIDIIQYAGWFGIGLFHPRDITGVMRISTYTKIQMVHNFGNKEKYLLEITEYLAAKRMNFVFAPSKLMAQAAAKDIRRKVPVIETPFLMENIKWDDGLLQTKLKDKQYLLFFGRMSVDKGILTIKDMLYQALQDYPGLCFAFAGISWMHDGVLIEKELMREAKEYKDRVIFLGQLSKNLLMPVIKNAEAVLMPSLADNFPNSCVEAMAMGKIVIGTDGSSLEQLIRNGKNGYLSEIGNASSLYRCLEQVLHLNETQRKLMGECAERRIQKLDLRRYSIKMERTYRKLREGTLQRK